MSSNPMIQSLEDQFLHWLQDIEKKQEKQARQMRELQDCAEHLQRENDRLRAQVEKMCNPSEKDLHDSEHARHSIARDKGKEPIVPDDVDTLADDELYSSSSPNLPLTKSSRTRSCERHSYRPAFSNADNDTFRWVRREIG